MTKQEIIDKSFGEDLEKLKQYINYDIGCAEVPSTIDRSELCRDNYDIYYISGIKYNCQFVECFRPKHIKGIHDNNNWVKIESENDLPKEPWGMYHTISDKSKYSIEEYWTEDDNKTDDWMENITHYQPITKPKPPIY